MLRLIQYPACSSAIVSVFVLFEKESRGVDNIWPQKLELHDDGVLVIKEDEREEIFFCVMVFSLLR